MIDKIVPTALRLWLTFLLLLVLLGYSVLSSILFGAIAGLAGGIVNAWWTTLGGEPVEIVLPEPIRRFGRQIRDRQPRIPLIRSLARQERRITRPKR
ncbi:hypothetical protein [Pseudanabaena sp. FACHB-2040]|uniref:hypothetical protein n=1 Tax=Pseudanabaena sp. FACHB-2040 TaxID=2692859 RepID=UPI0016840BA8|nr:hypothetical protein [Pseudanabaena sp. FACHB-2040]MBD2258764.1 hypothetical protein [Pseudanabaena sp. FACHB-2040]